MPSLTINATRSLTVNLNAAAATVSNAGTLTINGRLTVRGDVVNDGLIASGAGSTLAFENTAPNSIRSTPVSGTATGSAAVRTQFNNVNFASGGTTFATSLSMPPSSSINAAVVITGRALVNTGNVVTNGRLRLASSPTTTGGYIFPNAAALALINPSLVPGTVTGNITVERAINASFNTGEGYRHYSTPVTGPTYAALAVAPVPPLLLPATSFTVRIDPTYAYITNANPASFPGGFPNVYVYNQALVPSVPALSTLASSYGWTCPASPSVLLANGKGFSININSQAKVALTGAPNNGTYTTPVLVRSGITESGYHLVGNPYPCPLDIFRVMDDNNASFAPTVWFARSTSLYDGIYSAINSTGVVSVPSDSLTRLFPVMQGFFVRLLNPNTSAAYVFKDTQRGDPLDVDFYGPKPLTPFFRSAPGTAPAMPVATALYRLALADGKTRATDVTTLGFRADATPGYDPRYDAERPTDNTNAPTLSTEVANGRAYMLNYLPTLATRTTVPVRLATLVPGRPYTFSSHREQSLPAGTRVWLEDRAAGRVHDLTGERTFTFVPEAAVYGHRFFLRFEPAGQPAVIAPAPKRLEMAVYPNPAQKGAALEISAGEVPGTTAIATLVNHFGQVVFRREVPVREGLLTDALPTAGLPAGVYVLRVTTSEGVSTRRVEIR